MCELSIQPLEHLLILFKGADYEGKPIAGAAAVEAAGGRVELLPLLPGHSTSATVAAMTGGK